MGQEVGLYLQFNQGQAVEALVQEKAIPQLRHALSDLGEWKMETEREEGFVRARFYKNEEGVDGTA